MVSVTCSLSGGVAVWVLESSPRLSILAENIPGFLQSPSQVGGDLANRCGSRDPYLASDDIGHKAAAWALPWNVCSEQES